LRRRERGPAPALFALAAVALLSCESGTGGRPITFDFALAVEAPEGAAPGVFQTATGWEVTLEEACLAVGPVYLWAQTAHLARRGFSFVRRAHAHIGDRHFSGGEVRGEWLDQVALDLTAAGPRRLGRVNGLLGPAQSFSVLLDPPRGALRNDACLRGFHAYVVGTARRGDAVVPFEGGLAIDNVGDARRVDGIPLSGALTEDAEFVLTVNPRAWFDEARFDSLDVRNDRDRFVITADSQVRGAWFIGARSARGWAGRIRAAASATP
jgi:hypothetical protein